MRYFNKKKKKFLKAILLCSFLVISAISLTACQSNSPVKFEIEALEVKINGMNVSSLTVATVDESVAFKALLTGGKKIKNRDYLVEWEILGDPLGSEIFIEEDYADGTHANMRLGGIGGEVKVKATATSENQKDFEFSIQVVETDAGVNLPNLSFPDGITIQAAQSFYSEDVASISIYWSNKSDEKITFGNLYTLEKQVGDTWESVIGNETSLLTPDQYLLPQNQWTKISYNTSHYQGFLTPGFYRIGAKYTINEETFSLHAPLEIKPSVWYKTPTGSIVLPAPPGVDSYNNNFTTVGSLSELESVTTSYDNEYYTDTYFEEKQIIIYRTYLPCLDDSLSLTQIQTHENILSFYFDYHPGMLTAIGYYQVIIEVNSESVANITSYSRINQCNCPHTTVNSIAVILTEKATTQAYKKNKTYTPEDFKEYSFASVNNLFTGPPTGPGYKRILYLYLHTPLHPHDKALQEAIIAIANRDDVEVAEIG